MANFLDRFRSITNLTDDEIRLLPSDIFHRINTDSRSIKEGEWFLPLVGEQFDGHDYIENAIERGAAGYFYSDSKHQTISDAAIMIDDSQQFYGKVARIWREMCSAKIIGVTGSSGKTTFKEILNVFLQEHGITHRTSGNFNNEIGVPVSLLRTPSNCDFAIIEMGARHVGDLEYLSSIVQQNISVLLNVGNAHVGEFGSFENLVKTKCEIVKFSPNNSIAIVNGDQDPILKELSSDKHDKIFFSATRDTDVSLVETNNNHLIFNVVSIGNIKVKIPYWHESFPINIASVLATMLALGIELDRDYNCMNNFKGIEGRFRVIKKDNLTLIDDSYNANLDSMKVGIKSVCENYNLSDVTLILGDMLELGPDSEEYHRQIGEYINELGKQPKQLITIGTDSEQISKYLEKQNVNCKHFKTVDKYLKYLETLKYYDAILYLKASNSIGLNKIIDFLD